MQGDPAVCAASHYSTVSTLRVAQGGYVARLVQDGADLRRTQALRHLCFRGEDGVESDGFDGLCDHVMIEDAGGALVCSYRVMHLTSGADLNMSYSAQFYDLERLSSFEGSMMELGRFCVSPDVSDPDVVRLAWGMLAALVDARQVQMLFGCSSFAGTDPRAYSLAFDLLAARHLAPETLAPSVRAPEVARFAETAVPVADHAAAMAQVPALLKTYLSMGGWVSDHAVIDRDLNTLHVFTGLEIAAIPPARAKALRAIAG